MPATLPEAVRERLAELEIVPDDDERSVPRREPVATAVAITATRGVFLVGGATRAQARGRGAYRALVRARWDYAVGRGTPGLVVEAGRHSRPILERLGFEHVATAYLHLDRELR